MTTTTVSTSWLSPEETEFLERTLQDPKLYQYLYTREPIRMRYPVRTESGYREFASSAALEFQRAHQTMRRLMNKSPYSLGQDERAYLVIADEQVPLADLDIGTRITFGYRLLLLAPKYDIGKNMSLVELAFPTPIKILPVGTSHYIMDEDHIFVLTGFERRNLTEHPSHGTPYHIDLLRMVMTEDVRVPDGEEASRIHVLLDEDEKANLTLSSENWKPAQQEEQTDEITPEEFEKFKRSLGSPGMRFSAETVTALQRVASKRPNLLTKLLFEVHTHILKLSRVISAFRTDQPRDARYSDLEKRIAESANAVSKELDGYFGADAQVSATASSLYVAVSAKHMNKLGDVIGTMVQFANYLVGYTSSDSLVESLQEKPSRVVLSLQIPPRMPILPMPEHTGLSKFHRAVILPRGTVFQLEEIKSVVVKAEPKTYRKLYTLRYRRTEPTGKQPFLGVVSHLLQIEPDNLMSAAIGRDTAR